MESSLSESSTKAKGPAIHIFSIGLEALTQQMLSTVFELCTVKDLPMDIEKLMEDAGVMPHIVLVGPPPEGISLVELAQMLRMQYPESVIYYTTHVRLGFIRKDFVKNGFNDAFLLPLDGVLLKRTLQDYLAKVSKGEIKSYRPVKLLDIQAGSSLNFDTTIYMPVNKKYIQYSNAGDSLNEDQVGRLAKHSVKSIYVNAEQMPQFYQYSANRLKELSKSTTISETERKERLETSVRDLLAGVFTDSSKDATFEQGQGFVKDCQEIVKSFVLGPDASPNNWYDKMMSVLGEMNGGGYSHSANVSTFSALFSVGLGIGKPEELAFAGLLHDIGMVDLPLELQDKREEDMTVDEKKLYHKHPEAAVNLLKTRKIAMSEKVQKIILQHHECFNGTGFPRGLMADRICPEAQILAFADRFDELTTMTEGKKAMTTDEAMAHFKLQLDNPSNAIFDPELLKKILKLFPQQAIAP